MAPGDAQETHTSRSAARQPQTVPPVLPEKRKQAQATTFPRARFVCYAVFTALACRYPVPRIHTWWIHPIHVPYRSSPGLSVLVVSLVCKQSKICCAATPSKLLCFHLNRPFYKSTRLRANLHLGSANRCQVLELQLVGPHQSALQPDVSKMSSWKHWSLCSLQR